MKTVAEEATNLTEFTKFHHLKKNELQSFIHQISAFAEKNENEVNRIDLNFEMVYVKKGTEKEPELVFTIGKKDMDFSFELSKFLIRLLRMVDVNDKEALRLAYGLFVKSSKPNYKLEDLVELADCGA